MSNTEKYARNITALSRGAFSHSTNSPYSSRNKQLFAGTMGAFVANQARYASDYFDVQIQGIVREDFYSWSTEKARLADIVFKGVSQNLIEDWKLLFLENPNIDWIGLGAKVVAAPQTFIAVNPASMSSVTATAVLRRCNATWNYLDYYGNICSEPFIWNKGPAMATANDTSELLLNASNYQHSIMQLNPETAELTENMRMILGNSAYAIRGLIDFTQEFSDDPTSCHILYFDLYRQEPTADDDMENKVAGGNAFAWEIILTGEREMKTGAEQTIRAESMRNGEPPTKPVDYVWTSSNEAVATVEDGRVIAKGEGTCTITCSLAQNQDKSSTFDILVADEISPALTWGSEVPQTLGRFQSVTLTAAYLGGMADVTFGFSGADGAYSAETSGNTVTITGYAPSETPLVVTAEAAGQRISAKIILTR